MIKKYFYLALVVIVASLSFVITYDYHTKVHSRSDLVFMKNIEETCCKIIFTKVNKKTDIPPFT